MCRPLYEYTFNFNFRLKEDKNYSKRRDELIEALEELGFKKNLTTSSWFLYSMERDDLEEIEARTLKVLRKQPYSNKEDVASIQFTGGNTVDETFSLTKSIVSVLLPDSDGWEEVVPIELYELLDDLDDGEE